MVKVAFAVGIAVVMAARIGAQAPVRIRGDAVACASCRIEAQRTAILAVPDTAPALVSPFNFASDGAGRILFADPFGSIGVRVFTADGRYMRTIGRRGGGPGEFQGIGSIVTGVGEVVYVFHHQGLSEFGSAGRHVASREVLDGALGRRAVALDSGRFLVHASVSSRESFGHPFHVLAPDGRIERSFGLPPNSAAHRGRWSQMRVLADVTRGRFWSGTVNEYALERWDVRGERVAAVVRDTPWFSAWESWDSNAARTRPVPRLLDLYEDPNSGLLWTLVGVADRDWRPVDDGKSGREGRMLSAKEQARVFDSIVEVLDPVRGVVLSSHRFDNFFVSFLRGPRLVEVTDVNDEVVVGVWQLQLRGAVPR